MWRLSSGSIIKSALALGICLSLGFGQSAAYAEKNLRKLKKPTVASTQELQLRNWGLDNKEFASHINARKAWKLTEGKKQIVVAVIDTGIDSVHPELQGNLWKKSGSQDEYGFDFVTGKKNPLDTHGHGTHIAGIIGATAKGNAGASGVARQVSIMAVRYYSENASGADNLSNTVKAINYAIDNGAHIINYSGGGPEFSSAEYKAIQRAEQKGILFIAAAGNDSQNVDNPGSKYYPGAYGLTNIITVASTNIRNQILASSNYGVNTVHVASPGEQIYSTLPRGKYGYMTGTSQATAFVSGLAALILAENPKLKPAEVRAIIMRSADKSPALQAKIASGGRINAFAALKEAVPESKKILAQKIEKQDSADSETVAIASKNAGAQALSGLEKLVRKVAKE